jgi:hypothetical protein
MLNDDIVSGNRHAGGANDRNAGRGRCLAGDGDERFGDLECLTVQIDHAPHLKHDNAGALGFDRLAQRARTAGRERRHLDDLSAASARRGGCPALCAGETQYRLALRRAGYLT